MPNYQRLYTLLFNAVTDALEELERLNVGSAKAMLIAAQQQAEELYLEDGGEKCRKNLKNAEKGTTIGPV